ncbi:flagellar hook-length control protein FliK [Scandinavium sp. V105_16]|uniref:Flagellar hook-length control protein FliK n=1 Tax=Scandinavium lactucae TaxID=3095028 RepID=A0AAJ2S1D3_9ENTR|nr:MULTISPECIES: flagellar hook-length control protein FliK [unclassified Scandinavium]MDX6020070.1 flagellar hook-length control protein FliK [Scandinavium sp. V105_16]MDX6032059.1 flagellar hook-length control protein FliK [Scandinavium sp. V105_12]
MNLTLSPSRQLPAAAEPDEITSAQPAAGQAETTPADLAAGTSGQAAPAFNDALLTIINTLMAGETPRDNLMVMNGLDRDEDDDTEMQNADGQTRVQDLIGSPQQLLDALLMASQMPVKTLHTTQTHIPQTGEGLKMQSLSAGTQPMTMTLKPLEQAIPLNVTPELATDSPKTAAIDTVKALATALPATGQPLVAQTFSTTMDKQVVNLPPIKLDADEVKWSQQLHSALNDRLQLQVRNQVQHATIRLDPPEMGKMDISLHIENGRMQVHISASNGETYRALQQISNELRQSLTEQNVMQVNVQVSSQSGQQQGHRQPMPASDENPEAAVLHAEDISFTADKDDSVLLTV